MRHLLGTCRHAPDERLQCCFIVSFVYMCFTAGNMVENMDSYGEYATYEAGF